MIGTSRRSIASALAAAFAFVLSVWAVAHAEDECSSNVLVPQEKIVQQGLASVAEWPGLAVLRRVEQQTKVEWYLCGGTAISRTWVVTAAHCLKDLQKSSTGAFVDENNRKLQVILGVDNLDPALFRFHVEA